MAVDRKHLSAACGATSIIGRCRIHSLMNRLQPIRTSSPFVDSSRRPGHPANTEQSETLWLLPARQSLSSSDDSHACQHLSSHGSPPSLLGPPFRFRLRDGLSRAPTGDCSHSLVFSFVPCRASWIVSGVLPSLFLSLICPRFSLLLCRDDNLFSQRLTNAYHLHLCWLVFLINAL